MKNWFWVAFFSVFWLVPMAWHGIVARPMPGAPPCLVQATNLSCLFTHSQTYFPMQYIQVLLPGATEWTTEDDAPYLRMSPFGTRTRLDELLRKRLDSPLAMGEFTAFVRQRYARRTGVAPDAVRVVTGIVLPEGTPSGPFRKPPLHEIPHTLRTVWFTRVFAPVPRAVLRKPA